MSDEGEDVFVLLDFCVGGVFFFGFFFVQACASVHAIPAMK